MTNKLPTRRNFLKTLATAAPIAAASSISVPAIASEKIEWKMVTSWPKNSPGVGITAQRLADRITKMSDGRLTVKLYAAGELVPGLEVFDAVSAGTAEMAHTASLFWQGKTKAAVFFTTMPFGLTALEHMAWIYHGGGQALWDETYAQFGIKPFMAGNTGMQMGGWFKKEINSLDDLVGVKVRAVGLGGAIFKELGATPVFLPPSDIFPGLQSGIVDAVEFLGPWSDRGFGFYKAAPYYYWPTFNKPNGSAECLVNQEALSKLPGDLQAIVTSACEAENSFALAESDWENAIALRNLTEKHGVKLRQFPEEVMIKAREASQNITDEFAAGDPMASKVMESYRNALANADDWAKVSRTPFGLAR
ncbi:TRAP transporter substrate-binding protein [Curvivirga sp.]|uniref:TRAP transporter substrate-binding protein n=1 Tax=Curvivirga sp. TaxID=2856848 RepID=UPI003B5B2D11